MSMESFSLEWFGNLVLNIIVLLHQCKKVVAFNIIGANRGFLESMDIRWVHENKFVLCNLESLLYALCFNCVLRLFSFHSSFQGCQRILCVCSIFKIAKKIFVCEFYASRMCIQVCLWFLLPLKLSNLQKASIALLCQLLLLKRPSDY
jgi:hypothetical protein